MILAGAFFNNKIVAACAIPGAVLAAAYMLRMLQRVVWGGTQNPDQSKLWDLGWRETVTLAPLLVFVFWIGLAPEPFLRVMRPSLTHLLVQTGYHAPQTQALAEFFAR